MENTETPWEQWALIHEKSPFHGSECARGFSLKRGFVSWWGGTRNVCWMPALHSSQHKIKRRAAGQGDPGVEGNLGRGPGRSCCSHPYCKDEEMKLCFNGGNDLDSLGLVYSVSILNILTQIKANSAFRAAGGGHRRLSLQNRMRCLQLPPLPGDWVSSASSTLCAGTLHLLQLKKNPKTF